MKILLKVSAGLGVRRGEGQPVLYLLAYSFLLGGSLLLFDTAAYVLFLDHFDAGRLPSVYIAVALVVPSIGLAYTWLEKRLSRAQMLHGTLIFLVVSLLVLRLIFWLSPFGGLLFAAVIWDEVFYALSGLGFWALAGFIFDVRQGKRLFGLIGSGGLVAGIVSGLSIPSLVNLVGTENLILVSAVILAPCSLLLATLARKYPESFAGMEESQRQRGGLMELGPLKDRYIALIMLLTIFSFLIYYFLDYTFFEQADGRYLDRVELARFLGLFFGATRAVILVARIFFSGRLLARYGVKLGLISLPVILLLGTASTAAGQILGSLNLVFWLVVALKLANEVILETIYGSSVTLLLQTMPAIRRLTVQTAREMIAGPLAIGFSGAFLILYLSISTSAPNSLIIAMLIILIGWLGTTVVASREYTQSLIKALKDRLLSGSTLTFDDASSIAILKEKLQSPLADEAMYALGLLEKIEHPDLANFLSELLDHPSAVVRREALLRLEQRRFDGALPAIQRCLELDSSPGVQAAALQALSAVDRPEISARVLRYLNSGNSLLKTGAIVGLLRYDKGQAAKQAGRTLAEMVGSARPEERAAAARIIGLAGDTARDGLLTTLLADENPLVQRAALKAAGRLKDQTLWPTVIALLENQAVHGPAANALVAGGRETLPSLRVLLLNSKAPPTVLRRALKVIGRIDDPDAVMILVNWMDHPDLTLRSQALRSLRRLVHQAQTISRERVQAQIKSEVSYSAYLLALAQDLSHGKGLSLLQSALALALDQTRLRIFDLLAFIYEPSTIQRVQMNLASSSPHLQAYAVELLDILVEPDLKPLLLPLFEKLSDQERLHHLKAIYPQSTASQEERLREILADKDGLVTSWTIATAIHAVEQTALQALVIEVREMLSDRVALLRETALWTLCRLDDENRDYCISQLAADPNPIVKSALAKWNTPETQEETMLSTIEKVIILKSVSIFARVPDDVLADVAQLLTEVQVDRGEAIMHKGDIGDSMYIIVSGRVRVHDGERALEFLGNRDIFGEMALLDAEPRSASVTAEAETHMLRLDQVLLYELMDDYSEVARAIIRVLSGKLRERVKDLGELALRYS